MYEVRVPVQHSSAGGRRVFKVAYSNFNVEHTMPLVLDYMEIEGPLFDNWPPDSHRRIFFKDPAASKDASYAREIITRFATKAYRRPLNTEETDQLMKLFANERALDSSFEESIKVALAAVLCAPDFLFLVEPGPANEPRPLSEYELASRLSYFLWNSMPDDELFRCAEDGSLRNDKVLEAQIRRMLKDSEVPAIREEFCGSMAPNPLGRFLSTRRKTLPGI